MKNSSTILTIFLSLVLSSCNQDDIQERNLKNTNEELFASKTIEIFEALTTSYFPKEDVRFVVFKNNSGLLTAKYTLVGQSKREVQMGSFVNKNVNDEGTTCDGKWSCGKAIYKCLENGKDALISVGACKTEAKEYCVTCQDSK